MKICEGADKQLSIAEKLDDITDQWDHASFEFTPWKSRGVPVLKVFYFWDVLKNAHVGNQRPGLP